MSVRSALCEAARVDYEGRAQLGDGDGVIEIVVSIPDVEHPDWVAHIIGDTELPPGEVTITLLDAGIYNAWRSAVLVQRRGDAPSMLMGLYPLELPVGA
jgi:hypothetical protein